MASTLQPIPTARALFEPRAKLLGLLAAFILLIPARSMIPLALAGTFAAALLAAARVPAGWIAGRLAPIWFGILPFLLLLPFFFEGGRTLWEWRRLRITDAGLAAATALFLRATAIALWILFLTVSTNWSDGIAAARRLGLPRRLAAIALLAHRHIAILYTELTRIRIAVRARGFRNRVDGHSRRTVGHLVGSLFSRAWDRADHLHHALAMRGFAGELPTLHRPEWVAKDRLFIAGAFLFHANLLFLDWALR